MAMSGFQLPSSHRRFLIWLGLGYAIFWVLLSINPSQRRDWALENIVVVVGVLILIVSWRWFVFSRLSYALIALFLCTHVVGAHYTYSEVPYDAWFERITDHSLNAAFGWERNHYDRLVHFLYGLLLTLPFREAFLHLARVRWVFWSYLLPLSFILSTSLVYELLEWAAAVVLGGDLGMAFLGSQGDPWDAQCDSFCAMVGALLAIFIMVVAHFITGRDTALNWTDLQRQDAKG